MILWANVVIMVMLSIAALGVCALAIMPIFWSLQDRRKHGR